MDEVFEMQLQLLSFASDLLGGRLSLVTILEHDPPEYNNMNEMTNCIEPIYLVIDEQRM